MRLVVTRLVFPVILVLAAMTGIQISTVSASEENVATSAVEIPKAVDLSALAESSRKEHLPILLMYSAEDCNYCELLESQVIRPMLISGELSKKVIFRKIDVDDMAAIKDFHGKSIDPEEFAFSKGVQVTPTLQFVDGEGDELMPKIIGYQDTGFFNAYLDSAISGSQEKLAKR